MAMAATLSESQRAVRKKELLAKLRETGYISDACRLIGIDRATHYRWMSADPDYAAAITAIEDDAREARRVRLIQEAERRALAGSDVLLMFAIKALDPSYRDRQQIDLTATAQCQADDATRASLDDLRAELAQLAAKLAARGLLTDGGNGQT